jgi:hypothetical protein
MRQAHGFESNPLTIAGYFISVGRTTRSVRHDGVLLEFSQNEH